MARLNIAMLAQEAQAQEAAQQQTELEVVGQQAEDAIAEATQHQAEIEQTQQAMDETEEVIQEAEEERQVLEQAQQQGGAEPVAMEALQRAVKRFEKRTGVPCSVKSMGLESFSSKTTRMQSTKVAMEGAVDYIKKLIKMLMDAVAAVWEKVKAFVEKIIVGAERLAKRAKQVEELAKSAQGKKAPADAEVTISSALAYARRGGKVVEGKAFADEFIKQTSDSFKSRDWVNASVDKLINGAALIKIIGAAKVKDNQAAIVSAILASDDASKEGKADAGLVTVTDEQRMLGDYEFKYVTLAKDATWEQISAGYKNLKSEIVATEDSKKELTKKLEPLSPEDAKRVAHQAMGTMNTYSNLRDEQKKIDASLKKVLDEAKKLENEKDGNVDQLRVATGYIRAAINSSVQTLTALRAYDVNLSKAALDYAAASINLATGKGASSTGTQLAVV